MKRWGRRLPWFGCCLASREPWLSGTFHSGSDSSDEMSLVALAPSSTTHLNASDIFPTRSSKEGGEGGGELRRLQLRSRNHLLFSPERGVWGGGSGYCLGGSIENIIPLLGGRGTESRLGELGEKGTPVVQGKTYSGRGVGRLESASHWCLNREMHPLGRGRDTVGRRDHFCEETAGKGRRQASKP